ncbi:MAG: 4Fe-4S binding protein [Myxococcaceae bacterium]
MPVSDYFGHIKDTVKSAWEGMSVTLSYMFRRPLTIQYGGPDEAKAKDELIQDTLPPRYRGLLEVDMDICTACLACERACPINVIAIEVEKDPANPKQRVMTRFDIDEGKCMFCGLCVEPCPTGSIVHTREFEAANTSLSNLTLRFVDPAKPAPVYKPPKGAAAYPRVVLGDVTKQLIKQWDSPPPPFARQVAPGTMGPSDEVTRQLAGEAATKRSGEPLVDVLRRAQAGLDCGACTYPTCRAYAEAIASGAEKRTNLCEPGGDASAVATRVVLESADAGKRVLSVDALKEKYGRSGHEK